MIQLSNYDSGELVIRDDQGHELRLARDVANRLILAARMHTIAEFVEKLPTLVTNENLRQSILQAFEKPTSSERWNVKEKFARLQTLTKDYRSPSPDTIVEVVQVG